MKSEHLEQISDEEGEGGDDDGFPGDDYDTLGDEDFTGEGRLVLSNALSGRSSAGLTGRICVKARSPSLS